MNGLTTTVYRKSSELPALGGDNFFHSRQLFEICEQASRQRPYMVVTTDESGKVVSHMLGILRYRPIWLPPFLLIHCRVLGEGFYAESGYNRDELFGKMLGALTQKLNNRVLYMEISNLSQKMLGYKQLRQHGFYPVNWMSIHNSLHSHAPEERISEKMQKRIDNAHARGVTTETVTTEEDFKAFSKLLRQHNILKPRRYIPDDLFFRKLMDGDYGQLFATKYHGKVIGCSAVVYSEENAYLWYAAYRRKTYLHLHPDILTIWNTMKDAHQRGYQHMYFMDVGLPYSKNPFREFILRFGGKEQSTYRWFRFSIRWVNKLLAWIYRE
ncbi:MAG: GNAT family N-acetyltransferase [Prevotella sp.]|nr:GNAT family N-acetyltransferase [Prevotella sp.]